MSSKARTHPEMRGKNLKETEFREQKKKNKTGRRKEEQGGGGTIAQASVGLQKYRGFGGD
jgi:hypothetical protein